MQSDRRLSLDLNQYTLGPELFTDPAILSPWIMSSKPTEPESFLPSKHSRWSLNIKWIERKKYREKRREGRGESKQRVSNLLWRGNRKCPLLSQMSLISLAILWLSIGAIYRFSERLSIITYMFLPAGKTEGINLCMLNVHFLKELLLSSSS